MMNNNNLEEVLSVININNEPTLERLKKEYNAAQTKIKEIENKINLINKQNKNKTERLATRLLEEGVDVSVSKEVIKSEFKELSNTNTKTSKNTLSDIIYNLIINQPNISLNSICATINQKERTSRASILYHLKKLEFENKIKNIGTLRKKKFIITNFLF